MRRVAAIAAVVVIGLGTAVAASANTLLFSGTSISDLNNGTVTLDLYSDADGYLAELTWDKSTLTAPNLDYITAASVKVTSDGLTGTGSALDAYPVGTWSFFTDKNAANACGGGQNGGACAAYASGTKPYVSGGPYTWVFDLDGGITLLPSSQFSAQIDFATTNGRGKPNISTNFASTPSVPEPATMTLIGTGLFGIAAAVRRRRESRA